MLNTEIPSGSHRGRSFLGHVDCYGMFFNIVAGKVCHSNGTRNNIWSLMNWRWQCSLAYAVEWNKWFHFCLDLPKFVIGCIWAQEGIKKAGAPCLFCEQKIIWGCGEQLHKQLEQVGNAVHVLWKFYCDLLTIVLSVVDHQAFLFLTNKSLIQWKVNS